MKHILIFSLLIALSSCDIGFIEWPPIDPDPVDTVVLPITIPTDTITPIDSVVVDSCDEYITVSSPVFVGFYHNLDVMPNDMIWKYNGQTIDPVVFFSQYGSIHMYYSGINIGGVLTGNVTAQQFNGRVWVQSAQGGTHYHMSFGNEALHLRGAMIFFQFMEELHTHPHPQLITFSNTGYTFDQINEVLDFLLEDCKSVPTKIYLTATGYTFDPVKIAALIERGATII